MVDQLMTTHIDITTEKRSGAFSGSTAEEVDRGLREKDSKLIFLFNGYLKLM